MSRHAENAFFNNPAVAAAVDRENYLQKGKYERALTNDSRKNIEE